MTDGDPAGGPAGGFEDEESGEALRRAHLSVKRKEVGLSDAEAAELAHLGRARESREPQELGSEPSSLQWPSQARGGLRILDDIPPTDLLLAPTLHVLRESVTPLASEEVCEGVAAGLGGYWPKEGSGKNLRNVLNSRMKIALSYLERGAAITRGPGGYAITSMGLSLSDNEVSTWFDRYFAEDNPVRYARSGPDVGPWDMFFLPD